MFMTELKKNPPQGVQRHSIERLKDWERLGYGMFIHFGMSTFDRNELSFGDQPSTVYAPDKLDVDQWVSVARDAGMKYAVLTAKHTAGHCLWPTKQNDYHVGTSGNRTDVVDEFVKACERRGVKPGIYYCSMDNHNRFGSETPSFVGWGPSAFTTQAYREFQYRQVEELLSQYGAIEEVWIDIPVVLGHEGRRLQYEQIVRLQPNAVVMMNGGLSHHSRIDCNSAWPTDLVSMERSLPTSNQGYNPWHAIEQGGRLVDTGPVQNELRKDPPLDHYVPAEVCDPIGYDWFWNPRDTLRSDAELLGMRLICQERKANFLLDVPPDPHGLIPEIAVRSLITLAKNYDRIIRGI